MESLGSFQESQVLSNLDKICRVCLVYCFELLWKLLSWCYLCHIKSYGLILQNLVGLGFEKAAVNICGSVYTKPDY